MWCSGYRLEAYKTTLPSNLLGNKLGCSPQGGKLSYREACNRGLLRTEKRSPNETSFL